jgi:hypothetical protein
LAFSSGTSTGKLDAPMINIPGFYRLRLRRYNVYNSTGGFQCSFRAGEFHFFKSMLGKEGLLFFRLHHAP